MPFASHMPPPRQTPTLGPQGRVGRHDYGYPYPYDDNGSLNGAASRIVSETPITVLGYDQGEGALPLQPVVTMPLTRVDPVLEQGRGRLPWQDFGNPQRFYTFSLEGVSRVARADAYGEVVRAELSRQVPGQYWGQQSWTQAGVVPATASLAPAGTVALAAAGGNTLISSGSEPL
jgi:hypothetical protein